MSITRPQSGARSGADALAAALGELGLPARVEARAALAVVVVSAEVAARLTDPEMRRRALALAREQGFTHLALELS
ncbi:MAG: hypothetical protein JWN53_1294 [Gemmatimonadetes bacterium]|jgi:hypothetical protein|nr:hypothetical protein [Gemmatimonadota bacterium]